MQALHFPPLSSNLAQSERIAETALLTVTVDFDNFFVITGAKAALIKETVIRLIINSTSEKALLIFLYITTIFPHKNCYTKTELSIFMSCYRNIVKKNCYNVACKIALINNILTERGV